MVIGLIALAQILFILYMLRFVFSGRSSLNVGELIWCLCNRLSHVRSRQLFLTTYYDPLFPDLYLHLTHPEMFARSSENANPPWSIYHVPDAWARVGWAGVFSEFSGNFTVHVSDWQRQVQELWRTTYTRTDMPWPPQ